MIHTAEIISDINACEILWNKYSPKISLYDLWSFRFPFWEIYMFKPAFIEIKGKGLLPLWYQPDLKQYLWFGDLGDEFNWQEDTAIWAKDKLTAVELLKSAPRPLHLTCITPKSVKLLENDFVFTPANNKSVLKMKNMHSTDDFLLSLPKKLRGNIRRDFNRIESLSPKISHNKHKDLLQLFTMNKENFNDSPFNDEKMCKLFIKLTDPKYIKEYASHILSAQIKGITGAVDCIFEWNKTMYPLIAASNTNNFSGIGNTMHLYDIKYALEHGIMSIDFAETEPGGSKEKLFPSIKQYSLKLA